MNKHQQADYFESHRKKEGAVKVDDQDDPVLMILRHQDVRKCAHNWKVFQSASVPGRIVVPSEVEIRQTRQIPFELDPPLHSEYRAILEDWFRRPLQDDYAAELAKQISDLISSLCNKESVEVVSELALPLQSRALTLLLNIPIDEADTWISWGTHVFRSDETKLDKAKASILYEYIDRQIEYATRNPGNDLYSKLLNAEAQGRKLTKEEVKGIMILTFAGGRDTIINAVTNVISYFGDNPRALEEIKKNPALLNSGVEELLRYYSPLTHMGRVATEDTQVCQHAIKEDSRISLCWASANRDPSVFEDPNDILLDRKKNPHVTFGFGIHKCLGASHARQILKALIKTLVVKIHHIDLISAEENIEDWGAIKRKVGFHRLEAKFIENE